MKELSKEEKEKIIKTLDERGAKLLEGFFLRLDGLL